jgi:hypothetical protein
MSNVSEGPAVELDAVQACAELDPSIGPPSELSSPAERP